MRAAAARHDPDAHLGQPERGAGLGDAEVAGEGELEPATEAPARDRRDGWLRQGGDALVHGAGRAVVLEDRGRVPVAHLAHVGAGGEGTRTAGDDHRAGTADLGAAERRVERALERGGERVELRLAAQGDDGDLALGPDVDEVLAQGCAPVGCSTIRASRPRAPSGRASSGLTSISAISGCAAATSDSAASARAAAPTSTGGRPRAPCSSDAARSERSRRSARAASSGASATATSRNASAWIP